MAFATVSISGVNTANAAVRLPASACARNDVSRAGIESFTGCELDIIATGRTAEDNITADYTGFCTFKNK